MKKQGINPNSSNQQNPKKQCESITHSLNWTLNRFRILSNPIFSQCIIYSLVPCDHIFTPLKYLQINKICFTWNDREEEEKEKFPKEVSASMFLTCLPAASEIWLRLAWGKTMAQSRSRALSPDLRYGWQEDGLRGQMWMLNPSVLKWERAVSVSQLKLNVHRAGVFPHWIFHFQIQYCFKKTWMS